jgi:phosphatidate phosphatase APP1
MTYSLDTISLDTMTRRPRSITNLAPEDRVVVFPSVARLSADGQHWLVEVHGDVSTGCKWTFSKRMLVKLLARTMRATQSDIDSPLFGERIARFVAGDGKGRRVAVRIGDEVHRLRKKTRRNGHFQSIVEVPHALAERWAETAAVGAERYLELEVLGARVTGQAYLINPTGLSVISDIDDTLKHSHVACKRTLLANTFLRPFETIPGMARIFRDWWAEGAAFHYVSSSPWQLYEHLAAHLVGEGFPTGSFHLRSFRLRDHLLRRILMLRRSGKASVIRSFFKMFPHRQFLLVGDSCEHDPEIYGAVARRYPRQVAGILIRQIPGERGLRQRYARAFRRIDAEQITLFHDATELRSLRLPR